MSRLAPLLALATLALAGCQPAGDDAEPLYDSATVERRNLVVAVEAAGTIEPITTVELKSKASGEILQMMAETGDEVRQGALLVRIDPRTARNRLAQAEADLVAARSRLAIARAQNKRAATLVEQGVLSQPDYEQTALELATAEAAVVTGEVSVENARIALNDTEIRAPIAGTIIERNVEPGQVISSPTQDVGGGTLLMKMADLAQVQVRVLVDETDIGKIQAGMPATVSVSAYPNQPFEGTVLKVEPQAVVEQNVTMFGVLVSIDNRSGLLKPGMNSEVVITVARREDVLTLPVPALRTDRDLSTTAGILGIGEDALREQLRAAAAPGEGGAVDDAPPAAAERNAKRKVLQGSGQGGRQSGSYQFGSNFWVVAERGGERVAVPVKTGITDLDRAEILGGLEEGDSVLLLPSSHLLETQAELQSFITRRIGGVPGISQGR